MEHLRFSDKFTYQIDIDKNIDLHKYFVPAMLLQPHVENAIRHGLVPSTRENNELNISVNRVEGGILCSIKDNGMEERGSQLKKMSADNKHKSLGNKISKERLEAIRSLKLANISESVKNILCGK
ncbi:MAG: hypothetical protein IPO92_11770 [Saprospiraceae bacterium]|nr:hypothetical protein [Saprospiraceae bacterium]